MPALLTSTSMPPSALGRLADHAHDVVLVGDVAADEHVLDALLADLVHAGVDLLLGLARLLGLAEVVDRDVGAVLGEAHGDRLPDARAAARDQDVLALQARHGRRGGSRRWRRSVTSGLLDGGEGLSCGPARRYIASVGAGCDIAARAAAPSRRSRISAGEREAQDRQQAGADQRRAPGGVDQPELRGRSPSRRR